MKIIINTIAMLIAIASGYLLGELMVFFFDYLIAFDNFSIVCAALAAIAYLVIVTDKTEFLFETDAEKAEKKKERKANRTKLGF